MLDRLPWYLEGVVVWGALLGPLVALASAGVYLGGTPGGLFGACLWFLGVLVVAT